MYVNNNLQNVVAISIGSEFDWFENTCNSLIIVRFLLQHLIKLPKIFETFEVRRGVIIEKKSSS